MPTPLLLKHLSLLLILSGFIVLEALPVSGQEADEQYLGIYTMSQQADALNASGKAAAALAKYRQAEAELEYFRQTHPGWNPSVVAFRESYLAEKVATLSSSGAATNSTKQAGSGSTAGASEGQVKLLQPGAEPRQVLRLHPKPGDKQTLTMTMKMALAMKMGEMENPPMNLPPIILTMDVTTKSVSPDGDISYEMAVTDANVGEDTSGAPMIGDALKSAFGSIKGLSGTGTISNRGLPKGTELQIPADVAPQARQVMEQMKNSFARMATPLPEEPVGVGAKWEAATPLKSQGMNIQQTATYDLVSIEGERITARTALTQTAANQKIENPAMPGMKMDLKKMEGKGTGEVVFDLSKLMAPQAHMDLHSDIAMTMDMGGQKQEMAMKMDMNIQFEAKQ